jgi:hypothetical protein
VQKEMPLKISLHFYKNMKLAAYSSKKKKTNLATAWIDLNATA